MAILRTHAVVSAVNKRLTPRRTTKIGPAGRIKAFLALMALLSFAFLLPRIHSLATTVESCVGLVFRRAPEAPTSRIAALVALFSIDFCHLARF